MVSIWDFRLGLDQVELFAKVDLFYLNMHIARFIQIGWKASKITIILWIINYKKVDNLKKTFLEQNLFLIYCLITF